MDTIQKNYKLLTYTGLAFVPLPFLSDIWYHSGIGTFLFSCTALLPLAALMGKATEDIADRCGQGIGALMNATFGNACEFIIALAALRAGLPEVVKASLTGAVLGNALFVLGAAMLFGGINREKQKFSKVAAVTAVTLLATAAIGLELPAIIAKSLSCEETNHLSIAIASILFCVYILNLIFTCRTHAHHYNTGSEEVSHTGAWNTKTAILVLLLSTVAVVLVSEKLVHSIEPAAKALGMSQLFIGMIVVGIAGNAAEHSAAIFMAMKNKMDLAINIALNSATQVVLLIAPLLVCASHLLGAPMDLHFSQLDLACLVSTLFIVALTLVDGETNWFAGARLIAVYAIMAVVIYFA